jgi:hypothetical protein
MTGSCPNPLTDGSPELSEDVEREQRHSDIAAEDDRGDDQQLEALPDLGR